MHQDITRLNELLRRYFAGTTSEEENNELFVTLAAVDDRLKISLLKTQWDAISVNTDQKLLSQEITRTIKDTILRGYQKDEPLGSVSDVNPRGAHRVLFLKTAWVRYAAAILLIITTVSVYYIFSHTSKPETAVVKNTPPTLGKQGVSSGYNRAILTLSNGQKIELDTTASETIKDGTLSIKNSNGQLVYSSGGNRKVEGEGRTLGSATALNTMTTPKGGQYQLRLADGTRVWLNAASSITYPTVFLSKMRHVQITGEAYFEVAENKTMPFIVGVGNAEIKVLGTHFNVMAYDNEQSIETTLLEGSIEFVSRSNGKTLTPGQQLRSSSSGEQTLLEDVDVNKTIAWKNGLFRFENADIKTIMRQIERWYDVEVVFQDERINDRFYLEMPRSSPLSDILKVLRLTGKLKFDIDGKKIAVRR